MHISFERYRLIEYNSLTTSIFNDYMVTMASKVFFDDSDHVSYSFVWSTLPDFLLNKVYFVGRDLLKQDTMFMTQTRIK